jgi:hypothetical protein
MAIAPLSIARPIDHDAGVVGWQPRHDGFKLVRYSRRDASRPLWARARDPERRFAMPTYMDMHDIPGVKAADVVGAHEADVKVQGKYGVTYKHYWVDEAAGKVFCLVDAPDKESANRVHREAHGLVAQTLFEVEQGA